MSLDLSRELDRLIELEVLRHHLLTTTPVDDIMKRLAEAGLKGDLMCTRIATKLKAQLEFRHDLACDTSERHEGMGYSKAAITKHMDDVVSHEIDKAMQCIDAMHRPQPTPARRAARIEILDAMIID
jgi:hypothetical protein